MLDHYIKGEAIDSEITKAISEIHEDGPNNPITFEKLAYYKRYHPDVFYKYEKKLISVMGLFYKSAEPMSVIEEVYSIYSDSIEDETRRKFTPVQASAYREIYENRIFSFSAPTSVGKSFLFREIIQETKGDIVIVVPSRALISEYYNEVIHLVDKSVLVLQFIEDVNKDNVNRRVFIITPERGGELFKYSKSFNVEMFLFDEAQISEEHVRGMTFDSIVRRTDRVFPDAKKIFAHPYIENPEGQLIKHGFNENVSSKSYNLYTVGKIFISINNGEFDYFSPYVDGDSIALNTDIAADILNQGGTLLVYISKSKIYDGRFITDFQKYINICHKVDNKEALKIIEYLREYIGAENTEEKHSNLIDLMEYGIVVHHGSMPLRARLLIEQFIKLDYCRICFATSTLNQGINMPFDVVWIDNFNNMKPMLLKNLIGRSGRTSPKIGFFDFGYTIVKNSNVATFTRRLKESVTIKEYSLLDNKLEDVDEDLRDVVEAIRNDTYNEDLHLTETQVTRIDAADILGDVSYILDNFLDGGTPITGKLYYDLDGVTKERIKISFNRIYTQHLRRNRLTRAEASVLSTAIPIMLWRIQGKSFSEIVSLRHAYLSEKDKRRKIYSKVKSREISEGEAKIEISNIPVRYSQVPSHLPNKKLFNTPIYTSNISVNQIDYDKIVYDTYDYLDKVISLSLVDPICAAFELYYNKTGDIRAEVLKNHIRYGTNDEVEIWLMKYGFGFEEIEWLKEHVVQVDSSKITFSESIYEIDDDKMNLVERYL